MEFLLIKAKNKINLPKKNVQNSSNVNKYSKSKIDLEIKTEQKCHGADHDPDPESGEVDGLDADE